MGVAPTTSIPSGAARRREGRGGAREAQPRFALSHQTREIRVVPHLMRHFGKARNHNDEDSTLYERSVVVVKSAHHQGE